MNPGRPSLWLLILGMACLGQVQADPYQQQVPDMRAQLHRLADYRGKIVVLEWLNPASPFVQKHYNSDHMQERQRRFTRRGVVWLCVNSCRPGTPGHLNAAAARAFHEEHNLGATSILLDPDLSFAQAMGAERSPHIIILAPSGQTAYEGAVDNRPTFRPGSLRGAINYIDQVLEALLFDRPSPHRRTRTYGTTIR